jgi:shikimate dehydrogenase (EC 1.1.1.25)
LKNKNAVILGAGGASRAVLYSLIKEGAQEILIINRNEGNAKSSSKKQIHGKPF